MYIIGDLYRAKSPLTGGKLNNSFLRIVNLTTKTVWTIEYETDTKSVWWAGKWYFKDFYRLLKEDYYEKIN